jgi:hypothetical protein
MWLGRRRPGKSFEHTFDGGARRHFSQVLAADAIGQREQPPVGTSPFRRIRRYVAQEVFVVAAHQTGIGELGEFDF